MELFLILIIVVVIVVVIAVVLLRGFDRIAGRGPKQVKDGLNKFKIGQSDAGRVSCPHCAELILPGAKKCPFCKSELSEFEKG